MRRKKLYVFCLLIVLFLTILIAYSGNFLSWKKSLEVQAEVAQQQTQMARVNHFTSSSNTSNGITCIWPEYPGNYAIAYGEPKARNVVPGDSQFNPYTQILTIPTHAWLLTGNVTSEKAYTVTVRQNTGTSVESYNPTDVVTQVDDLVAYMIVVTGNLSKARQAMLFWANNYNWTVTQSSYLGYPKSDQCDSFDNSTKIDESTASYDNGDGVNCKTPPDPNTFANQYGTLRSDSKPGESDYVDYTGSLSIKASQGMVRGFWTKLYIDDDWLFYITADQDFNSARTESLGTNTVIYIIVPLTKRSLAIQAVEYRAWYDNITVLKKNLEAFWPTDRCTSFN